jgi:hypothetical protein
MATASQTPANLLVDPTIDCPPDTTTLPTSFTAYGTVDTHMFIVECYFWTGRQRKSAKRWHCDGLGGWVAQFDDVPVPIPPNSGHIWVVADTDGERKNVKTAKVNDLTVDPTATDDPCPKPIPLDVADRITLASPKSGDSVSLSFPANGTLSSGTTYANSIFSCPSDRPSTGSFVPRSNWQATFSVSACPPPGGSLIAFGNDGSSDGHGDITAG